MQEAMRFRQASLRQAIADIIKGKEPTMENEAEVEFKARMEAQDKLLEEQIAALQAKKAAEQEAQEVAKAEHEAALQANQKKPKHKPKRKPKEEINVRAAVGRQRQPQHHARPDENMAVRMFPWLFGACCCKNSEVNVRDGTC